MKVNPDFLKGKMALFWTGMQHGTKSIMDKSRPYQEIAHASCVARDAVRRRNIYSLCSAIRQTYKIQLDEGMVALPERGELAKKYTGAGHGGCAIYVFDETDRIQEGLDPVEPYIRRCS